jgi:hypothetical protein
MASRNPALREEMPLRAPQVDLSKSRQQFIQSLQNKQQFEQECVAIIPELDRLWQEKILDLLNLAAVDVHQCSNGCGDAGCEYRPGEKSYVGFLPNPDTYVINWKHYLFNYAPQLLVKAITRLSSRLKFDPVAKTVENARGEVKNISAYYKSIVQDLRKKEVKRENYGDRMRTALAAKHDESRDYQVGEITPWGIVTVVDARQVLFGNQSNPYVAQAIRINGTIHSIECEMCYEEEGSYSCVRPAHFECGIKSCTRKAADHSEFCSLHRPGITYGVSIPGTNMVITDPKR